MRIVIRSGAWLAMLVAATAGCGGRTGDDGFGASANDAGLGGFTVVSGGSAGSAGYAGYAGSYVGAGGSIGGYAGSFGGSFASGGRTGCGRCPFSGSCGPGQQQVTLPGQCCPTCQQCPLSECIGMRCGPGQQLTMAPGQCCPVCSTGTPTCFGGPCPEPVCPPGSGRVTPPGQCCPVCISDPCASVQCDPPACPPGSPTVTLPGQCCPSCSWPFTIDASVGPCDQNGNAQFLQKEMIALDALSCTTASDCLVVSLTNSCALDCGTAVNAKASKALYAAIQQFANANCSGCPSTGGSSCGGGNGPNCVNGQCQLLIPLPASR